MQQKLLNLAQPFGLATSEKAAKKGFFKKMIFSKAPAKSNFFEKMRAEVENTVLVRNLVT